MINYAIQPDSFLIIFWEAWHPKCCRQLAGYVDRPTSRSYRFDGVKPS